MNSVIGRQKRSRASSALAAAAATLMLMLGLASGAAASPTPVVDPTVGADAVVTPLSTPYVYVGITCKASNHSVTHTAVATGLAASTWYNTDYSMTWTEPGGQGGSWGMDPRTLKTSSVGSLTLPSSTHYFEGDVTKVSVTYEVGGHTGTASCTW